MLTSSSTRTRCRSAYVLSAAAAGGVLLAACSGQSTSMSSAAAGGSAQGARAAASVPVGAPTPDLSKSLNRAGAAPAVLPGLLDRSIIRTATMTVRVKDVVASAARAETLAAGAGGFVAGEQTQAQPDRPSSASAIITMRVPGARLSKLLADLSRLGVLLSEDQAASDVTGQVIDVAARIQSQQASVNRIRTLLGQAKTIGQVVEIESELANREGALESLKGQAKALADQTSLATLTATLVGPGAAPPVVKPAPAGFGHGLSQGWKAFTDATTWLLTALGTLLPFLIIGVPVAWAALAAWRRRAQLRTPAPPVEPTPDTA